MKSITVLKRLSPKHKTVLAILLVSVFINFVQAIVISKYATQQGNLVDKPTTALLTTPEPFPDIKEKYSQRMNDKSIYLGLDPDDPRDIYYLYKNGEMVSEKHIGIKIGLVDDFYYDESSQTLFLITRSSWEKSAIETIARMQPASSQDTYKELNQTHTNLYSTSSFLGLDQKTQTLIIRTGGGDGCGGWGLVWTLSETKRETVIDYGAGCFSPQLPRFTGYYDGNVYLHDIEGQSDSYTPKDIYAIDPLTRQRRTILPKNKTPKGVILIWQDETDKKILKLFTRPIKEYYEYNLETGAISELITNED